MIMHWQYLVGVLATIAGVVILDAIDAQTWQYTVMGSIWIVIGIALQEFQRDL